MCPDRKIGWFKEHLKYPATQIKKIKTLIVKTWKSKYAPQDQPESSQVQKKDNSHKGRLVYFNYYFIIILTQLSYCVGVFKVGNRP